MTGKILFIRRDNIGDLVCTTPAISAARKAFPNAKIGILVNTYNAAAIADNPDIDEVYVYEKAKHAPEKSRLKVWISNAKVLRRIRQERYDVAIGCGSYSPRLARYTLMTGARMRIGYVKGDASHLYTESLVEPVGPFHEAEITMKLLAPLCAVDAVQQLRIFPSDNEVRKIISFADDARGNGSPCVAMHISSRRPENRWPAEHFVALGKKWAEQYGTRILLLWSPGSEKNVRHPGDDEKAQIIADALGSRVMAYRTTHLSELIAALSISDVVVCGDGGAMHLAAGLGKPIVAIWGCTNPDRWRPFGVEHVLLRDESRNASNIEVDKVFTALKGLV